MTPKDKAKELTDKYYNFGDQEFDYSKEFALIAVDEMLKHDEKIIVSHKTSAYKSFEDFNQNLKHIQNELDSYVLSRYSYWQEVKQEITQL
jgi:hypothetical protein